MFDRYGSYPDFNMPSLWKPRVDVCRGPRGWLCKVDLAGVRRQDIKVLLQANQVHVSGMRRDVVLDRKWRHHILEISYSRFERKIELPDDLSNAEITIDYRDGMLLIWIIFDRENVSWEK